MKICVFSSSSNGISSIYFDEALKLSRLIGENRQTLINGGANVGLMEHMLKEASKAGAKTIGVIPEKMNGFNLVSQSADEIIISKDMMERKAIMRDMSDAFIAMPGGFGTLEEILEVITLKQLDYHDKPIVFLNIDGFFNDLFNQFERSFDENFAKLSYKNLYFIAENCEEAIHYIKNYQPVQKENKWHKVPGDTNS